MLIFLPASVNAQWVKTPLDSGQVTGSGYWDDLPGSYWEFHSSRMMVSEASESIDGRGALRFSYRKFPVNSWGDYAPVRLTVSPSFNPVSGFDLSNSRYLSFWIKYTKPGKLTAQGKTGLRFRSVYTERNRTYPETRIPVFVPGAGFLTLEVYDLEWRQISVCQNWCLPGENKVILHLNQQPTGLYIVRFFFGNQRAGSKLLLLK